MKKYLRKIEWNLMLPRDVRRRVMEDLNSTIAERREAGQSDEQIMAELGKPQKVAEELNRQMQDYMLKKTPWRFVCLIAAAIAFLLMMWDLFVDLLLSSFLTGVNDSVGIIGGADGPTAIFVTTATGPDWEFILFGAIFVLGIAGYFWLRRGRK